MGLLEVEVKMDRKGRRVNQDPWESLDLGIAGEKVIAASIGRCLYSNYFCLPSIS